MNKNVLLLLLGTTVGLAGCSLAPRYGRPDAPVPAQWPNGAAYPDTGRAADAPQAPDLPWRQFFPDPNLQSLIEKALANNRDLRSAALNVEQARALYGIQRGQLVPTVDAMANGSKQNVPADLSFTGERATSAQYSVGLGVVAWELDFFGRIRSLSAAALQQYLATEQARRSVQILLVSSVANTAMVLAADRENLGLAETTLANQQEAYKLVKRNCDLGLAPLLDLYRAQTQVDVAKGDAARFRQIVAQDENALNLLLGSEAPVQWSAARLADLTPPAEISAATPSEVLLRRPDVLAAENQLRATYANIGAARASLFPRISLTATAGTASSELSGLFKSDSGTWNFAPQASMPIFDTRAWQALKVTRVQREIAVAQYEKAIQNSFREVADALAVSGTVDAQVAAQQSLVGALAETYRLSLSRYDKGIDSYLSVLDAQRSLYAAQQGLTYLRLEKLTSQVRLYAALGGGGDVPMEKQEARGKK
jgi:multidrug efflux system outer membrane protein